MLELTPLFLAAMQALLARAQVDLNLQPGEFTMFTLDMPNLPNQSPSVVMVAQANQKQNNHTKPERVAGVCAVVANVGAENPYGDIPGDQVGISPWGDVSSYFKRFEHRNINKSYGSVYPVDTSTATIMQVPRHGALIEFSFDTAGGRTTAYRYKPDAGYLGDDDAVIDGEVNGLKVKLHYYFHVLDTRAFTYLDVCGEKGAYWKISSTDPQNQTDFTNWQTTANLNAMLANASQSLISFSDLAGTAVGETKGQGTSAQITLDSNAAGHGWFVDATPGGNEEFLPTADANIWQARAGSLAAGKMDMLSVLLHEYGHALGIERSTDSRDFMAPNLQAGERRLPTADELALMSQLVAALKPQQDADSNNGAPQPLPRPYDPSLPLGGGFAFMAMGRVRRTDYGWSLNLADGQSILAPAPAQFQTAINSTLGHNANDWQTAGNVSTDNNNGTITLAENSQANAHLSQSFAVKQGDRYLSFTVANNDLHSNGIDEDGNESMQYAGPNDAFEVALLNANSGLTVAGTDGLSRSDAILNIQTDGTEHQAASVRKVHNADGSNTYYVDLQQAVNESNGLVTGTPVTLSFDLMGFGAQSSQVALRDIQLIQDPIAFDDVLSTNEDVAVSFNPSANDLLGSGAVQLNISTQPAHGSISINPDGSLSYTPAAHFYGVDSFSYTSTVGGSISNTATVQINVQHVNHAPTVVGGNLSLSVTAGKAETLQPLLLASATDSDGDVLHAIIDTAPAHGSISINPDGSWSYTADADYVGADSVTYHIEDDNTDGSHLNASSTSITLHFNVQPANTAPVANNVQLTVLEDGSISINFADPASGLGVDAEGDALSARTGPAPY